MNVWVEREAMRLLRVMDELQAKVQEGAYVSPSEVAVEAGLDPGPSIFEGVVNYLEYEGAIVRDERFGAQEFYQMTRRGLEMLGEDERP